MIEFLRALFNLFWVMTKKVWSPPTVRITGKVEGKETYMGNYTPSRLTVLWWNLVLIANVFRSVELKVGRADRS